MLLRIIQSILSIILIPLMLLSTTGVRISQHWCGNNLVNFSIWGEAEPCDHFKDKNALACPMHADMPSKNCCSQKQVDVEAGDEDFKISASLQCDVKIELNDIASEVFDLHPYQTSLPEHFRNHSPPILGKAIFIKNQSFLI